SPSLSEHRIFGTHLAESLKYASVQISTTNSSGEPYVWGYIPVVIAKCGLFLKENATEVPGTFRIHSSNRRLRKLQALFEVPPRYGKSIDWKQELFDTHEVANVFRRFLTRLPESVIPSATYHVVLRQPFNHDEVIAVFKRAILAMPRANQYLLLYVLDLLSVFARKSDKNLMTATELAAIFEVGLISNPAREMEPAERSLSQRVLEFLIAEQDWFTLEVTSPPPNPKRNGNILVHDEHSTVGGPWSLVNKTHIPVRTPRNTMVSRSSHIEETSSCGGLISRIHQQKP
ncbi:Rho GTPase activation protein, partial [Mycena sanguinolenta]